MKKIYNTNKLMEEAQKKGLVKDKKVGKPKGDK